MARKEDITFIGVGDILIDRPKPVTIFNGVRSVLEQADLLVGNQEGPINDRGERILGKDESGSRHVRSVLGAAAAEAEVGFDAMALGNNHMMDWGKEGMFQTMEMLKKNGIAYCGAGANLDEARAPVFLKKKGVKLAMLAYTSVYPVAGFAAKKDLPGVATVKVHTAYQPAECVFYQPGFPAITVTMPDVVEMEAMLDDVRRAKKSADLVVVQFHWGVAQGYGRIIGYMKEMGRAAVDAGADLIMGNHPHLLLGFEMYREKLICYSLNHFAFDIHALWQGWLDGVILKAKVHNGRFQRFSVIPVAGERVMEPKIAKGARRQAIVQKLEALSKEFGTTFTPEGQELVIGGPLPGTPEPLRAPEVLVDNPLPIPYPTSRGKGIADYFGGRPG